HFLRQIGGDDFDAPAGKAGELLHAHRDRIGFLPGGRGRAPDPQRAPAGARLRQRREDRLPQMIERNLVAEEKGLVGGHRLDHFRRDRLGAGLDLRHQLGDPRQSLLSRQRDQPAFDQILLVGGQVETGTLLQELAQKFVVQRRHERSPANSRTSFGAIWLSGRMAAQMPAFAAAPGIPHTTLEASSWAITLPPAAMISLPPRMPSEPMPVNTTARTPACQTSIAEANRGSTAGLQKLTGGPSSSAIAASVPWRTTRMWRPPGAR